MTISLRRPKRLIAAVVVVATLVVGRVVADPARAEAEDSNITWNIQGGGAGGEGNNGAIFPSQQLAGYVGFNPGTQAYGVATQEMCIGQFQALTTYLAERGYKSRRIVTHGNPNSPCNEHGNAIFWRGGCHEDTLQCQPYGYYATQTPDREPDTRGYICSLSGTGAGLQRCSTHLNHLNAGTAQNQAYEYYVQMLARASLGAPVLAMGDFNLLPAQFPPWTPYFLEGDPTNTPTHANGKIDRALYSYPFCVHFHNPPAITSDPYSDHKVYRSFKTPTPC